MTQDFTRCAYCYAPAGGADPCCAECRSDKHAHCPSWPSCTRAGYGRECNATRVMQPANFNACVTAAVSDVFEDATMAQCAEVARRIAECLTALQGEVPAGGCQGVYLGGGTAGSAYLGCAECSHEYLSNDGEWGGPDKPKSSLADLVAAVEAHQASTHAEERSRKP